MRNTLYDLNNYLFEQLERLNDDELTDDQLEREIRKNKAVISTASVIINNASLALEAEKLKVEYGRGKDGIEFPYALENNS